MYIGIDLGGSKIAGAGVKFSPSLKVGRVYQEKTPKERKAIVALILDIVARVRQDWGDQSSKAVGVGVAGQIHVPSGKILNAPNISAMRKFSLGPALERKLGIQVILENDANCFALSEAWFGAGKNSSIVCGLTIGTGVGGGIIINKKIFSGAHYSAGEIGHVTVVPEGILCSCGNHGCLEQYINKRAIVQRYKELTGKQKTPLEIELESYCKKRNNPALEVIEETGRILGLGLSIAASIVDPHCFVLGGGIGKTKTLYLPARAEFQKRVLPPQKDIKIIPSKLGGTKAGIVGAALQAKLWLEEAKGK